MTSTATTTIPEAWEQIPCVQYGFPEEKGPKRAPKLQTIFEPIPDGAETASPVYILTRDQYERQDRFKKGYEVVGYTSIATELQDEAEAEDNVLYPIHIESDVYHREGPEILINWFRKFTEDYLDVPFNTCTLYFSGRRSIHVHCPRFVSGEDQRERLQELAETFNEQTEAELDCGIYDRKPLFRLPGVEHTKSGLQKVEIQPEWDHDRIIQEASTACHDVPESYEVVLRRLFATRASLVDTSQTSLDPPHDLFSILDTEQVVLDFETDTRDIETPVIEDEQYPENTAQVPKWAQYNSKEFSPYAFAAGNPRSVAAIQVKGGAFARHSKRGGATMIPAWFYGAVGCNGEFTKEREHAPLQLSPRDYEKWDFQPGDTVVIIGGQSRHSKILEVASWQATIVGHALTGEDGGRSAAYEYLEAEGYNTGSAGSSTASGSGGNSSYTTALSIWPARDNPQTETEELQRQAEQEGINTLTHPERIKVACRHLRYGWKPAWDWFQEQFGTQFKPEVTWKFFKSIVEDESHEEYDHVEVPKKPT